MKLNRIHAVVGLLLVLVPFTGFSREFKYGFSVVAGAVILYFAINSIHIELRKKHRKPHNRHDTFVESKPVPGVPEMPAQAEEASKSEEIIPASSHIAEAAEEREI
jgi:hypothetical protein